MASARQRGVEFLPFSASNQRLSTGQIDGLNPTRSDMAGGGGDAQSLPPHDLAVIIGLVGLVGSIFMLAFSQSAIVHFDEDSGLAPVREVKTGFLGSNDKIVISHSFPDSCSDCHVSKIVVISTTNSNEVVSEHTVGAQSNTSGSTEISMESGGEHLILLEGHGEEVEATVTVQRQLPIQYLPAVISLFVLVWGVWRSFQESSSNDSDIDEVVAMTDN